MPLVAEPSFRRKVCQDGPNRGVLDTPRVREPVYVIFEMKLDGLVFSQLDL